MVALGMVAHMGASLGAINRATARQASTQAGMAINQAMEPLRAWAMARRRATLAWVAWGLAWATTLAMGASTWKHMVMAITSRAT